MPRQASQTSSLEMWPLERVPDLVEEELCKILWNWEECNDCEQKPGCVKSYCVWQRRKDFEVFFKLYKEAAIWSVPEERPALRDHQDLLNIVRLLKINPDTTRRELIQEHFSTYGNPLPDEEEQGRVFDLAVKVMTTVECNPFSLIGQPKIWKEDESLRKAITRFFPLTDCINLHDVVEYRTRNTLRASRLKRLHGLDFEGTDHLNEHLLLDTEKMVLKVYHHTAFLKEYLRVDVTNANDTGYVLLSPGFSLMLMNY
jgi:hypothetical protein